MKTKKEMIETIASNIGSTQKNVKEVLEGLKDFAYGEIENGEEVRLIDGVVLGVKIIKGREFPVPSTGKTKFVPDHYGLKVRFGKEAKNAVAVLNNSEK